MSTFAGDRLAYRVKDAAAAAGVSVDIIHKALRSDGTDAWPPPLRAKQIGTAANAPKLIEADELRAWIAKFPEAS